MNLIKNPVNPMFSGQATKYDMFRAKLKVWIPTLVTLDGTDFSKDTEIVKLKPQIEKEKMSILTAGLASIPEEG